MLDSTISDILSRLSVLEQARPLRDVNVTNNGEQWVFFPSKIDLVYTSPTASTDWADTGSAKYIPQSANKAILFAAVEDTTDGVARTLLESNSGGSIQPIASLYEIASGAQDSSGGQVIVPVVGGRIDWRVTLAPGATAGNVRIELVGYVK